GGRVWLDAGRPLPRRGRDVALALPEEGEAEVEQDGGIARMARCERFQAADGLAGPARHGRADLRLEGVEAAEGGLGLRELAAQIQPLRSADGGRLGIGPESEVELERRVALL